MVSKFVVLYQLSTEQMACVLNLNYGMNEKYIDRRFTVLPVEHDYNEDHLRNPFGTTKVIFFRPMRTE